jgi:hypothetical protein
MAFARYQLREKEPARRAAIRSRCQSSEVAQERFRLLSESQLPKGHTVVTAHQHGTYDSGGLRKRRSAKRKTLKGGTKGAFDPGRTRRLGKAREKPSAKPAMSKKAPLACEEKQPESEEARPVAQGERTDKIRG